MKNAYKALMEMEDSSIASTSQPQPNIIKRPSLFESGYGLPCSTASETVCLDLCFEALPMLVNLGQRRVDVDTHCVFYAAPLETIKHVMLECLIARLMWAMSNPSWKKLSCWSDEVAKRVSRMVQQLDSQDQARPHIQLGYTVNMNKSVIEGVQQEPCNVVKKVVLFPKNYQIACTRM
ncbi:UNVERIFIED_CONTAM: hypothetical protein Sindi_0970800 [Sesamum indicum]